MTEKTYQTNCGVIHYWINQMENAEGTIVFLPGLTADHRLFEKQAEYFSSRYRVFVWDAPGHAKSWPFTFDFTLMDKARWLDEIFQKEGIEHPIIVGQSMGGYVGQAYAEQFPQKLKGFVAIDSAPLQRKYVTAAEIWLLKRMEPVYRYYPWKSLLKTGSEGVAETAYGKALMKNMMMTYDGDQKRYSKLAGHGYRMLAEAMEADLQYQLPQKSLLICGKKDKAGSCVRYNKAWHKETGIPLEWIEGAGHNSNTDAPERVNALIEKFVQAIDKGRKIK